MQTSYLHLNDYLPLIQSGQLNNQVLDYIEAGGNFELKFAESWAIGKVYSILKDYFDLDLEFKSLLPFDYNKKYFAGDRIIIDFHEWQPNTSNDEESMITYSAGDCVILYQDPINKFNGFGYICKVDNSDKEFDKTKWTAIGKQYDIYYIEYPYQIFCLNIEETNGTYTRGFYDIGDLVFYKNHIYKCRIPTTIYSHSALEQFYQSNAVPAPNSFPDSKSSNQWEDLGEYSFINELPFYPSSDDEVRNIGIGGTDGQDFDSVITITGSVWTLGDNRDTSIIVVVINLALWLLHNRISPNNIPEIREVNKNNAFSFLRAVKGGTDFITIPHIQPTQIGDISCGYNIKKKNGF